MKMETLMNIISNIANFREGCELYIFHFCILFVPCACDLNNFLQENKSELKIYLVISRDYTSLSM